MANEHPLSIWRKSQPEPMTQRELAERLGIQRWMANSLEKGRRRPSIELAVKIQEVTNNAVTIKDFLRESPEAAE